MKIIFKVIVITCILTTAPLVSAEIYNWVDEKGTVHFTEDSSTIPEKYRDQTKSRTTEENHMTMEERILAKQERQVRELEEVTEKKQKGLQEEEDSYRKCYNCDGKGYIGVEVAEMRGGIVSGRSFHGNKTCSICEGTGKLKK
jgi:hypothetical protein